MTLLRAVLLLLLGALTSGAWASQLSPAASQATQAETRYYARGWSAGRSACSKTAVRRVRSVNISQANPTEPKIGRFLSRDPIGYLGGPNLYSYVGNSPLDHRDPFGLQQSDEDLAWQGFHAGMTMFGTIVGWFIGGAGGGSGGAVLAGPFGVVPGFSVGSATGAAAGGGAGLTTSLAIRTWINQMSQTGSGGGGGGGPCPEALTPEELGLPEGTRLRAQIVRGQGGDDSFVIIQRLDAPQDSGINLFSMMKNLRKTAGGGRVHVRGWIENPDLLKAMKRWKVKFKDGSHYILLE